MLNPGSLVSNKLNRRIRLWASPDPDDTKQLNAYFLPGEPALVLAVVPKRSEEVPPETGETTEWAQILLMVADGSVGWFDWVSGVNDEGTWAL